jgi:NAD(P)-dependent dehydrogenase (short-subunit alcohol dehydrogenase family)
VGTAVALQLAADRPLLLHGRDEAKLHTLRQSLPGRHPHEIWIHDLKDISSITSCLETQLQDRRIAVEGFVHCAGVAVVLPARGAPLAQSQDSLNINFLSAQQIVASLLKRRCNAAALRDIVFVSAICSRVGVRGHSIYCASKAALDGLMRALAVELAPATRVNSILPGLLETRMASQALGDTAIAGNLRTSYPLGIGLPQDVANAVSFLLSPGARWITGQEFILDGGRTVNFSLK